MDKTDLKRELKQLYSAKAEPALVDVPALNFLMVDGQGDPNTAPAFQAAVEALYSVAYTCKFMLKKGPAAADFAVPPLEGLWWCPDMRCFSADNKDDWLWTLMIALPDFVTAAQVQAARTEAGRKKDLAGLAGLRCERFHEGLSAQVLHVGPHSEEGPTIARLHAFIKGQGYIPRGKHHEIYLSDPRRTAPAKWKTIIRQPMARA